MLHGSTHKRSVEDANCGGPWTQYFGEVEAELYSQPDEAGCKGYDRNEIDQTSNCRSITRAETTLPGGHHTHVPQSKQILQSCPGR